MVRTWAAWMTLVVLGAGAAALDRVPEAVIRQNRTALERIAGGAGIRAVWVRGKFGEYGDRVHVLRFSPGGVPQTLEGKFIRLGDGLFRFERRGKDWRVRGKFGDGGGTQFWVIRDAMGRIQEVRGRFYHYGDDRFRIDYYPGTRLIRQIRGKFARWGDEWFQFFYEAW